ncbi:MAG: M15 family metallopeptidase [Patescibacteria group bacterium]
MPNKVYDPETDDESVDGVSSLGAGHDRAAGIAGDPRGENVAAGDPSDPRGDGLSRSGLLRSENEAVGDPSDPRGDEASVDPEGLNESEAAAGGYAPNYDSSQKQSRGEQARSFGKRNRGKLLIFGTLGGTSVISIVIGMFTLIPLKIEHMVSNLDDRFYSAANEAVGEMTQHLTSHYIRKYVIPAYKNCGTTIDRHCKVAIGGGGSNPVTNMYRSWAKARFENDLYYKYQIEFKFDTASGKWRIVDHRPGGTSTDIGKNGEHFDDLMSRKDRKEVFNRLLDSVDGMTKREKVQYRYKMGTLVDRTWGTTRCMLYCALKKKVLAPVKEAKKAAKYLLAERVLAPRSELTAIAMACFINPDCQPDHTKVDPDNPDKPPSDGTTDEQREKLKAMAAEHGLNAGDTEKLIKLHAEMSENGFQNYLIKKMTTTFVKGAAGDVAAKRISGAIPYIGWIDLSARTIDAASNAGPKIKKLGYMVGAASAVQVYMEYRTYADEAHTGNVDPVEMGSMADSLGKGVEDPKDPLVGGTASAEEAPLYNELVNGGGAPAQSPNYLCNNGKPPATGKPCSEEMLGQGGNGVANAVSDFVNSPGVDVLVTTAKLWKATVGKLFDAVNWLASETIGGAAGVALKAVDAGCSVKIPVPFAPDIYPANAALLNFPFCQTIDKAKEITELTIKGITNYLLPNALGSNMGGGRTFTLMAAGSNVAANDTCEQMGCQAVDDTTATAIINKQRDKAREEFARQPFFARMFSTDSSYSLVSKMAMATPFDMRSSAATSVASLLSNPFSVFGNSFGSIVGGRASAANGTTPDPFGIGNQAFPSSKIPDNPEAYWNANNCGDETESGPIAQWQKAAASPDGNGPTNENTGMPVHVDSEPCLLIKYSTGVNGGFFDKDNLNEEDLAELPGAGSTAASSTATEKIDMDTLFESSANVGCAENTKDIGVEDGYTNGKKVRIRLCAISNLPSSGEESSGGYGIEGADGKCIINSRASGAVYAMVAEAKKAKVTLSANSCFRTMNHQKALWSQYGMDPARVARPGYSNHQMGLAIDISGLPGDPGPVSGSKVWAWLSKNADKFSYKNYPAEAWHWSPTGN